MAILMTEVIDEVTLELVTTEYDDAWIVRDDRERELSHISRQDDGDYEIEPMSLVKDGATFRPSRATSLSAAFSEAVSDYRYGCQHKELEEVKDLVDRLDTVLRDLEYIKKDYDDSDIDEAIEIITRHKEWRSRIL